MTVVLPSSNWKVLWTRHDLAQTGVARTALPGRGIAGVVSACHSSHGVAQVKALEFPIRQHCTGNRRTIVIMWSRRTHDGAAPPQALLRPLEYIHQ